LGLFIDLKWPQPEDVAFVFNDMYVGMGSIEGPAWGYRGRCEGSLSKQKSCTVRNPRNEVGLHKGPDKSGLKKLLTQLNKRKPEMRNRTAQ